MITLKSPPCQKVQQWGLHFHIAPIKVRSEISKQRGYNARVADSKPSPTLGRYVI